MKKRALFAVVFALILISLILVQAKEAREEPKISSNVYQKVNGGKEVRVFIKLKETNQNQKSASLSVVNSLEKAKVKHNFGNVISAVVNEEDLSILQNSPLVEEVGVEKSVPLALQDSIPLMNVTNAWKLVSPAEGLNLTGMGQTICILDTGTNYTHPDLGGCYGNNNLSSSCKVWGGYDYVNNDADPMDDHGHGTHVAGIAAANGSIKGVAPGARIITVKICDDGTFGCFDSDIKAGIDWCVWNASKFNISVISMSIGGGLNSSNCDGWGDDYDVTGAINNAVLNNISVVIASGNGLNNDGVGRNSSIAWPACISNSTPVGATDKSDAIASYSNRYSKLYLFATGSAINSTTIDGRYSGNTWSGTSMATPHVAGTIAVINQFLRTLGQVKTPKQIEAALNNSGKRITDSTNGANYSRIRLYDAIIYLDDSAPNVSLINPLNNYANNTRGLNQTFRCNATDLSLRNATFYLWNSSGIYNQTFFSTSGARANLEINITSIAEETYNWNCLFYDEKGNLGFAPNNFSIILDTTSPRITINSPSSNLWYNFGIFNVSLNEAGNCSYSLNGAANRSLNSSDGINFYYTNTTLAEGMYNITYYCNDSLGNANASSVISFSIDLTAPNVTIVGPEEAYSATGTSTLAFQFNASDNINITNCSLVINGGISAYNSSAISNDTNTITKEVSAGVYTWSINCTDEVGNTGNSTARSLTINEEQTQTPSGGGGSGGGTGAVTYSVTEEQAAKGYTKELKEKDRISFAVSRQNKSEGHNLIMNSINPNEANMTISSNMINFVLRTGEEKRFNLSSADYFDFSVKLGGITNKIANVTIKTMYEKMKGIITGQAIAENKTSGETENITTQGEKGITSGIDLSKYLAYLLVIIFVIALVIIMARFGYQKYKNYKFYRKYTKNITKKEKYEILGKASEYEEK